MGALLKNVHGDITKLYAFSFLQLTFFPMAIINLFWKEHIGLGLILCQQNQEIDLFGADSSWPSGRDSITSLQA